MFKFNTKFDAESFFYLLSHFECDSHTVHMLTQWHLLPPLTSTVKSLFTCEHPVHSPWLSGYVGYMDVAQTILVIITKADFFQPNLIYLIMFL